MTGQFAIFREPAHDEIMPMPTETDGHTIQARAAHKPNAPLRRTINNTIFINHAPQIAIHAHMNDAEQADDAPVKIEDSKALVADRKNYSERLSAGQPPAADYVLVILKRDNRNERLDVFGRRKPNVIAIRKS